MNAGKVFEQDFQKSTPDNVLCYRLRDGTASWGGGETRFQTTNVCDFIMFNAQQLYFFELKTTKSKSLPIKNILGNNESKGLKKIKDLQSKMMYENVCSGYIINLRELGRTFFIYPDHILNFIKTDIRKSLPLDFLERNGIEIDQKRKITRYKYDIGKLLEEI